MSKERKLKVVTGTWNVHEKDPHKGLIKDVKSWLHLNDLTPPDIVAVGFQEIEMSGVAMIAEETQQKYKWSQFLKFLLDQVVFSRLKTVDMDEHFYCQLCSYQLVGIYISVFVMNKHKSYVQNLRHVFQRDGFVGLGNKGGIGISFNLYGKNFCFFNVHLPAHDGNVEQRNHAIQSIINDATFKGGSSPSEVSVKSSSDPQPIMNNSSSEITQMDLPTENSMESCSSVDLQPLAVKDHDFTFILGDFNYRISPQGQFTLKDVKEKIAEKRWLILRQCDQLINEMKRGKIMKDFREGTIDFAPTYKYKPGTNEYSETKKRIPSWTDRIFYSSKSKRDIDLKFYGRHESLLSDHKPVSAVFEINFVNHPSPTTLSTLPPPPPSHLVSRNQHVRHSTNLQHVKKPKKPLPLLPKSSVMASRPVSLPLNNSMQGNKSQNKTIIEDNLLDFSSPPSPTIKYEDHAKSMRFDDDTFASFFAPTATATITTATTTSILPSPSSSSPIVKSKHQSMNIQSKNLPFSQRPERKSARNNPFSSPPKIKGNNPFDDDRFDNAQSSVKSASTASRDNSSIRDLINKFNTHQ